MDWAVKGDEGADQTSISMQTAWGESIDAAAAAAAAISREGGFETQPS